MWTNKKKRKGHSKINDQIICNIYAWITHHSQVFQSPISNNCIKVIFDDQTEPQLIPNVWLRVSFRELNNIIVSDTNYGGLKDARDKENNIIISDSTLSSLLLPQLKKISAWYKVKCGCEYCLYAKSIHSSLLSWRDWYLEKLKYQSQNSQNRRSSEKANYIYETYKNTFRPHGCHIYAK